MSSPPSSRDLGSRIRCLDYKPQLQCTSVSTARREPAPPAISTGNRSSAQLGYQASRQREACLFEMSLVGKPRPREAIFQDRPGS